MPAFTRILTLPSEVKAVTDEDGARFVEGYSSSGAIDRQNEVVNQKALLRSYERAGGMPYLRDHDSSQCIGHIVAWEERDTKVWTRAKILPEGQSQLADDLWNLLQIDTPVAQSIGFNPIDLDDWGKSGEADDDGIWHWGGVDPEGLLDIETLETSAVVIGASRDADLHIAKGLGLDLPQPWLEGERKAWGNLSADDIRSQVTAQLMEGQPEDLYIWVEELYEGYVIVQYDDTGKSYRMPFTVVDGTVVLGEATEVTEVWIPAPTDTLMGRWEHPTFTKEQREEKRLIIDLTRAAGATEAVRNYCRHLETIGRTLSPEALELVGNPMLHYAEIMRAGRILSDQSRLALQAALDAIGELLMRDAESPGRTSPPEEEGATSSILDARIAPSVLDLQLPRRRTD